LSHSALSRDEEVVHGRRAPAVRDCQSRASLAVNNCERLQKRLGAPTR
jgi:hypothetical protein